MPVLLSSCSSHKEPTMTDEQIKDAVCKLFELGDDKWFDYEDEFIAFARLIAEKQKEIDARICEATPHKTREAGNIKCAEAIRSQP